jgi:hypothetical protein
MDFVADFAPSLADFGIDAVIYDGPTVRVIFDDAYGDAFGGMIAGTGPMARLPSSVAIAIGNLIAVAGKTYRVSNIEPDGTGMTLLRLELA